MNTKRRINELTTEQKDQFNTWMQQIQATNLDDLMKSSLRLDYGLANDWISLNEYRKDKGTLKLENWKEATYLLRDSFLTEQLLVRIDAVERRNALTMLNGYKTRYEISMDINVTETHIGKLLKVGSKSMPFPDTLTKLAVGLDVAEEYLIYDQIRHLSNSFNNFTTVAEIITLQTLFSKINEANKLKLLIVKVDTYCFQRTTLYVRIRNENGYQAITVYGLNENSLEVFDFLSWLGTNVLALAITPALFRKQKKVVYYRKLNNEVSDDLQALIEDMRKRKYTRVTTL
jgi:transcriptional regulator with XRE-family HTH domain